MTGPGYWARVLTLRLTSNQQLLPPPTGSILVTINVEVHDEELGRPLQSIIPRAPQQ